MSETGSRDQVSPAIREGQPTTSTIRDRPLAHVAGALGIAGQLASAYWYLLYPLLIVPSPVSYVFFGAWFVLVGLTVAWWRHHPLRSFLVPVVSVPVVILALGIGITFLGLGGMSGPLEAARRWPRELGGPPGRLQFGVVRRN